MRSRTAARVFILFVLPLFLLSLAPLAGAAGERIKLTPEMLTAENNLGDPSALVDEQELGNAPLPVKPVTNWGREVKADKYPIACVLDLGRERDLGTLWLCDKNAAGPFRVQAGHPGAWHDVVLDDLRAYDLWKEFRLNEKTRYLRFVKETPGSNVSEIALFEKSAPDAAITQPTPIDEVRCGDAADPHPFKQFPEGASQVQPLLGQPCRVLPNETGDLKYFAYRIGGGKGLKAGGAYQLEIDYPEDAPRQLYIQNRGCEESLGFHTGATVGDVLKGRYVFSNAESLKIPLSGKLQTWKTLFFLHDRFPEFDQPRGEGERPGLPADGFWVIVSQPKAANAPLSKGAAVAAIRLYAMPASACEVARPKLPEGLPRRHIFCREEMGDGVVASDDPAKRGVLNVTDWFEYKARRMRYLGMDTFTKDLLEFGANQGWDAAPGGGMDWVYGARPNQWENILTMLQGSGLSVLPYYEYCGGKGGKASLGVKRPAVTLGGGRNYTHIGWTEIANCDVTSAAFVQDVHKLLDCTIYRFKEKADFLGAWFRQRPTHIPVSFSDRCLGLFAAEANGGKAVTRAELKADKASYEKYLGWWYGKRHDFFAAIRDDLRAGSGRKDAFFMFTADSSEPGLAYPDWNRPLVVTDDVKTWTGLGQTAMDLKQAIAEERHYAALTRPQLTWSWYEWQHSVPVSDPWRYQNDDGLMLTYTFNRAYTVGSAKSLEAFRTKQGLALVRHYSLNENEMSILGGEKVAEKAADKPKAEATGKKGKAKGKAKAQPKEQEDAKLGYFVCDVERAGPYCMLAEALAMANGDPDDLGYLSGYEYNRGWPELVRDFNLNFLALPALPSRVEQGACGDAEVVVRSIATEKNGTWLAVINTGWGGKEKVAIKLPGAGAMKVTDAVTGAVLAEGAREVTLSLRPCQLKALRVEKQ